MTAPSATSIAICRVESWRRIGSFVVRLALASAFLSATASEGAIEGHTSMHDVVIRPLPRAIVSSTLSVRTISTAPRAAGSGPIAFRPVDASLLQGVAIAEDGKIWIAPYRHGAQTSGPYERIVQFDPRTSQMSAFKMTRIDVRPSRVV